VAFLWGMLCLTPAAQAQQGYQPGQVVGTNFGFSNRYRWTNDNGRVFLPNDIFRLSDFDGKIVFFVFFDYW
jgi:hypothetical protein